MLNIIYLCISFIFALISFLNKCPEPYCKFPNSCFITAWRRDLLYSLCLRIALVKQFGEVILGKMLMTTMRMNGIAISYSKDSNFHICVITSINR